MPSTDAVHDTSLLVWTALAAAHATGWGRPGPVDAAIVVVNLISGTPAAWQRAREGRHDLVALLAPVAVGCAVVTTARPHPRWAPTAATALLLVLRISERRHLRRSLAAQTADMGGGRPGHVALLA